MRLVLIISLFATLSCATTFTGAAKVPNGAAGCKAICSSYGMELTGMVALGEYSDGCICGIPGKQSAAASGAAAVATMNAMIRQREEATSPPTIPPMLPPAIQQ
ncbi:MAG: hypothetical protein E6J64_12090 [Deltaproteobacteria bacterium]|nr:MAG: hypothetical protein E6J64_12090 [Deltaproteobacteria bacterium]